MNKCLWVLPRTLFPIKDGASVANRALMASISGLFRQFDLTCFGNILSEDRDLYSQSVGVRKVFELDKKNVDSKIEKIKSMLSNLIHDVSLPLTASSFISMQNMQKFGTILSEHYECMVFDGLHPYALARSLSLPKKIIYRAHNVEQDLWAGAIARSDNPIFKSFLKWQGEKMAMLENELCRRAKVIWAISPEDLDRFRELGFGEKTILVNCGMEFQKIEFNRPIREVKQLLFLGKLDWAPNRDGLVWFLENVWGHAKCDHLHLNIVGSGKFDRLDLINKFANITLHGFVPNLEPLFESCDASIVPIHYGSGTRIKVIDCVSRGMPIISTAMGVQGSGLLKSDYLEANSVDEWISVLTDLKGRELRAKSNLAYDRLFALYDLKMQAKKAYQSIR